MSLKKNLYGILLCAVIAVIATFLSSLKIDGFALELIGAPVMSILFGLIISLQCRRCLKRGFQGRNNIYF